jgi:hypothetical protein
VASQMATRFRIPSMMGKFMLRSQAMVTVASTSLNLFTNRSLSLLSMQRPYSILLTKNSPSPSPSVSSMNPGNYSLITTRLKNRNARRPKQANHGKKTTRLPGLCRPATYVFVILFIIIHETIQLIRMCSSSGKRPVSHARRWLKRKIMKSRGHRPKIFGFWYVKKGSASKI